MISPSELLPPLPFPPNRARRRSIAAVAGVLAVALGLGVVFWRAAWQQPPDPTTAIERAQTLYDEGELQAGIVVLKDLVQHRPEHAQARYSLGAFRHANGDFVRAERDFRAALDAGFDKERGTAALARALLLQRKFQNVLDEIPPLAAAKTAFAVEITSIRGLAYLGVGKIDEAKILFDRALESDPEAVDALLGSARIAAVRNRPDEAGALIDQALQYDARSLDALLMKAELQWALGRVEAARASYQRVLETYPVNPQAHLSLAWIAIREGRLAAAEVHSRIARKAAPESPQSNYVHALLEFRRGNLASAKSAVAKALQANPGDAPSLLLAGGIAYAEQKFTEAQGLLLRGLERVPAHLGARKLYAATLLEMNQPFSALDVLLPTLQIAAEDAELLKLIGQTYLQAGDHANAIAFLEKASQIQPRDVGTRAALGLSHMAAGRLTEALAVIESGLLSVAENTQLEALLIAAYVRRGDVVRAEQHWAALERKQPDNPATFQLRAAILAEKKDIAGARKALEQALMLAPTYVPAAIGLAKLDLDERDPANARKRLEKVLRVDPRSADAMLALAEIGPAINASREERKAWLIDAQKLKPRSARAAVLLARMHLESGNAADALAVARAAQKSHPEDTQVLDVLGAAQVATGDTSGALGTYAQLSAMLPRSVEVLFRLGRVQLQSGSDAAAGVTLRKVLEREPNHAGALAALADIHVRSGRQQEALALARKLQARSETAARGHGVEGDAHAASGSLEAAAAAYEEALEQGADGTRLVRLHDVLTRLDRTQEGDERLQRRIAEQPDDVYTRLHWADLLLRRKKYAEAAVEYLAASAHMPDNARIHNNIAWAMFQAGDRRARQHAERALALQPDDPAILDTNGLILVHENETERGIAFLQRAVARAPDKVEPRLHLAQAWLKTGDHAKARTEIEQALRSNPPPERVAELQDLLRQATL